MSLSDAPGVHHLARSLSGQCCRDLVAVFRAAGAVTATSVAARLVWRFSRRSRVRSELRCPRSSDRTCRFGGDSVAQHQGRRESVC